MTRLSVIICMFVVTLSLIILLNVSTQDVQHVDKEDDSLSETEEMLLSDVGENVGSISGFRNRKTNVSTYNEWSDYRRVSDNIQTGSAGGSMPCTESITFSTEVSGYIFGLGKEKGTSKSSSIGYTLNVGADKRVYMGYRVYYKVETGTNEFYDTLTGEVLTSGSYTIKVPQDEEYALIDYFDY